MQALRRFRKILICTHTCKFVTRIYHENMRLSSVRNLWGGNKMNEKQNYYLGFDIGTSSIGWAVSNENYQLLRAKGKDLWGVRLFKEAETSASRRTFRIARRMRQREKARIGLLKDLFSSEIDKVDPSFFIRLDESKYHFDDKTVKSAYALFNDANFNDVDYFKKYPTVFHLRKDLIECTQPKDVRLVFLALLSIYKRRGHFLSNNLGVQKDSSLSTMLESFTSSTLDLFDLSFDSTIDNNKFALILADNTVSRSKKAERILDLHNISKKSNPLFFELVKSICGLSFDITKLFQETVFNLESSDTNTSFKDADFEEKYEKILDFLDDSQQYLLDVLKSIHDQSILETVMQGCNYLSDARVRLYEKHHNDLSLLKKVIKKFANDDYDSIFRSDEDGSYSAYVGSVNSREKVRRNMKKRKAEDLYATLRKTLKKCPKDDSDVLYILNQIEVESFLPKQLTFTNSVIPHQVHLDELSAILTNASDYLPFLTEKDASGLTTKDKIIQIYSFQIPYFVGPLNNYDSGKNGNAWVIRNSNDKVYPWNFHDVVDVERTSFAFIDKLIRSCTYVNDEKVLPKSSLLYQKYMVLNELNNLRIRGEKPSIALKQQIFNDLFLKGKKVTQKVLLNYLYSNGVVDKNESGSITGIDTDFVNSLNTFGKFHKIFGDMIFNDDIKEMVERIVQLGTIYGNDTSYLKRILKRDFGKELDTALINRIAGFKFSDWGRFSKQFLEMKGINKNTGEVLSIIQMMWETNDNLMELLSDRYTYSETLNEIYKNKISTIFDFEYDDLDEYYLSSPVKRMVWQSLLITRELVSTLKGTPNRIFIEMAREKGEKGARTVSRKNKLINLYRECKTDVKQWVDEINNLDDSDLRSKKLYLYYSQKGLCMYSGERIEIQELFNENLYDIDHIYPRKLVKDDSLDNNLVLVKKKMNSAKGDIYPVSKEIQDKQLSFWSSLLGKDQKDGFITLEKYRRLVNRTPLSDEQLAQFVSRQLVETRQGTKVVTQILSQCLPETEIVFIKAKNITDFRNDFDIPKTRIVNDFHHAHDAYLSIVVGNTYHVKFSSNPINFFKNLKHKDFDESFHMGKLFLIDVIRGNQTAWIASSKKTSGSLKTVKSIISKNTPLITKMTFHGHGGLFNATIYSSAQAKPISYVPLKSSDPILSDVEKYGGYSSVSIAYWFLVEHDVKKKRIRTLESLPIMFAKEIDSNPNKLYEYCTQQLKLINPSIRLPKIKIQSLIKKDGYFMNITGKTNNQLVVDNFNPLILHHEWISYLRKLEKVVDSGFAYSDVTREKNIELYDLLAYKHSSSIFAKRPNPINQTLIDGKENFEGLSVLDQCKVIGQILQISQLSNIGANLELIGASKMTGKSLISKNISNSNEFKLIHQSVTGLYIYEIDLLKI